MENKENGRLYDDIHKKGMQGLKKENNELKDRIAELEKRCHFIWALGYDYDGYEKAESLKSLIDELVGIAQGNWGDVYSKCENKQDNLINDKLKQYSEKVLKFVKEYAFKDSKEIYTNGAILVPLFRVEYAFQTGGQDYQQG